jgi:hypothetical protein
VRSTLLVSIGHKSISDKENKLDGRGCTLLDIFVVMLAIDGCRGLTSWVTVGDRRRQIIYLFNI